MIVIKLRDANKNNQRYGDIILTKSTGIGSKLNMAGQFLGSMKTPSYTHALLCLNPGCFIEATIGSELLAFDYRNKDVSSLDSKKWKVIRYNHLTSEEYDTEIFHNAVYAQLGKSYSLINKTHQTFCSSFIAMVYNDLFKNSKLFEHPNQTLPVTLEHLTKDIDNWTDVTKYYKTQEKSFGVDDKTLGIAVDLFNNQYESIKRTVEAQRYSDEIKDVAENIQKLAESLNIPMPQKNIQKTSTDRPYKNWMEKEYLAEKEKKKKRK